MHRLQLGLAWAGIVLLVALVLVGILRDAREGVRSLAGPWSAQLLDEGGSREVGLALPALFESHGLPPDSHLVLERRVVLPEDGTDWSLWLERAQYAVAVRWDGELLGRSGDPADPRGARNDISLLVPLPDDPGPHDLSIEIRGAYGEGGLTGRLLLGPHDQLERIARDRETERVGLALVLAVLALVHLGVATRPPVRPTFLLFGLFAGSLAFWSYAQADVAATLMDLGSRIRLRRLSLGLFTPLGLAFVAAFLYGRPRRGEQAMIAIGAVTSLLGLLLPLGTLYRLELVQDLLLVTALAWILVMCVHGAAVGIRGAAMLLIAVLPPLLVSALSDILVSHGWLSGQGALFPATTLFVVGVSVALSLRHADDSLRHERLLDGSPDAIVSVSRDGRIDALNPTARRWLGPSAEGAILADLVVAEDRRLLALHLGHGMPRAELRLVGQPDALFESVATELDNDAVLLVLRDVTRRRELDGVMLQAARLETVGVLVGGIAHDFNNMLGTLLAQLGFLQLADPDEATRDRLQRMEGTIERASLLVRRMLTVARGTSPELEPLDLAPLCLGARELVEPTLPPDVKLILDVPEELPLVLGAGPDIEQVLVNLVVNARDAVASGGHIAVRVRHVVLGDGLEAVVVVVEDDGPGVDDARKDDVFQPFVSSKSPRRGSGLGLAVAAQIVRDHLGRLWVEDRPGGGARFLAALRVADAARADDGALPEDRTVLLVEDEVELLESYTEALRNAGYEVTALASGDAAAARLRDLRPGILVTDVVMPGCSGIDLAETCNTVYPDVPVLLVSGYVPQQGFRRLGEGRWTRLDKPVRPSRLVAEVGRIRRRVERGDGRAESRPSGDVSLLRVRSRDLGLDEPAWAQPVLTQAR